MIELIGRPPRPLDYSGSLDTPLSHPAVGDAMPAGQPPSSVQRYGAATPSAPIDKGPQSHLHQACHPRLNGKVERSHRIDGEEFYRQLKGVLIDDTQLFNEKLAEWEAFHNYDRPHGRPGGQTPYERLRQVTAQATTPE